MAFEELIPAVSTRTTPPMQCAHRKSVIEAIIIQVLLAYN